MKKLSFAGPILLTTILLFAAACGRNTATETVPPQTQIASESDFFSKKPTKNLIVR